LHLSCPLQVRMHWLVLLRGLLTVGFWLWYARMEFAHPFLQAAGLNLCSLAVSAAMDCWYRRLYASSTHKVQRVAVKAGMSAKHEGTKGE